ncbi:MAG: hypothetical protein U5K30_02325 [Acidimicrobiales bacterium]|nr:hypothetical protein [Acidimicrobiales bacterium]
MARSRRPVPPIEEIRIVRGVAAPGAVATTFGSWVFVRRGFELTPRLLRHEYEHVCQYHRHGWAGFLGRYVRDYLRWRLLGYGHRAAYRRIPLEIQAEWRARRNVGSGTQRFTP